MDRIGNLIIVYIKRTGIFTSPIISIIDLLIVPPEIFSSVSLAKLLPKLIAEVT